MNNDFLKGCNASEVLKDMELVKENPLTEIVELLRANVKNQEQIIEKLNRLESKLDK
ncbi:hypothetical protein CLSAB_19150 [Clostridium saccharobutylicum]|uniref:hypothetical protein n=1 Tax=Clostridium saccharobutylicum TaxID=169679 RepID=UPI0009D00DCD|nr:hypothetical protein [Clostridium saccharobutylicum]OOM17195.1 hypothetical protein CLSAB_19150 [Clostridium saccharobutylicum]